MQQDVARVLEITPHASVKDYDDILARLRATPELLSQTMALLQKGIEQGITTPRVALRDVPEQIQQQMVADPDKSPLLTAFKDFPKEISVEDRQKWKSQAAVALKQDILPAFDRLYRFFTDTYLPRSRETIALSDVPDGKAWYAFDVRDNTTTSMSPDEIHRLGLAEVSRIRKEMDAVIARTGFKGDFAEFSKFLRTDPRFFHTNAETLLRDYRNIAKRADPELARLFGKLPRLPYGVKAVPAYAQKSQTTAYYEEGSAKAGRPGWFFANTYALDTRPTWEMIPLTLHEGRAGAPLANLVGRRNGGFSRISQIRWLHCFCRGLGTLR